MKLRLIAEGSTKRERKTFRWGLSFLVGDVLFDAFGRSDIFWNNVRRFKIDLTPIKRIVISHEDWDHIAALESFLKDRPKTRVCICKRSGHAIKKLIRTHGGSLIEIDKAQKISRNIFSLGQMRADTGRGVLYEQALVVKSSKGFSVITGCAHPGIVGIVKQAIKIFGKKIYAVCGGFHMKNKTPKENKKIVKQLRALGVKRVVPLHCTGAAACRLFQKNYRGNFLLLHEGKTLIL